MNELFVSEVTPIGRAAVTKDDQQRLEVVKQLLAVGVDPNRGHAVLGACAFGDVATLEVLLAAGARLDAADLNGVTCAHAAAHNGRLEMLEYLLARGHGLEGWTEHNRSPLDVALFRQQEAAVLLLLQHGLRPRAADALHRFVNQPPTDTDAKLRIRKQFIDNEASR